MNGKEELILAKIDDLHTDVREIRTEQGNIRKDVTELMVASAETKGRDRTLKYVFSAVVPFLVAALTTAAALAFGL
ncbi:MAG: hypothetical protein ACXABY_29385 [Candidatus Thorarchaeota archaeon]